MAGNGAAALGSLSLWLFSPEKSVPICMLIMDNFFPWARLSGVRGQHENFFRQTIEVALALVVELMVLNR